MNHLGQRDREAGEIIPASVEQSATYNRDDTKYGAGRAIDMDLVTRSIANAGSDGKVWIKVYLNQVHCIKNVKRYGRVHTWTCTKEDCSNCVGKYCDNLHLTVSTEGATPSNLPDYTDCRYGNTVRLGMTNKDYHWLTVYETAIIGKLGNIETRRLYNLIIALAFYT